MTVARDHLGRDRLDLKSHGLGDVGLHAWIDLREGADRTGDGAGRDLLPRSDEASAVAVELGVGVSELEAEGDGLGMDAVRAADHWRELVLALDLVDAIHVEDDALGLFPDPLRFFLWDRSDLCQRVGSMGLDLEPDLKSRLRLPDGGH